MNPLIWSALLLLYSLLFTLLRPVFRLLPRLVPKLRPQLESRAEVAQLAQKIAPERARFRHGAVFFCSSAGEFEQARPLIARLQAMDSVYVYVVFFSKSGLDYVKARGESIACCLVPLSDSVWQWGWLFSALRPDLTCVVRHELWPGFLYTARQFGKLYLIDASPSLSERGSWLKRRLKGGMLRLFDQVFAVSEQDLAFFRDHCGLPPERLVLTSDTKYDRVLERAQAKTDEIGLLRLLFDELKPVRASQRLVLGSAYREEVELLLAARQERSSTEPFWHLVIAPHVVSEEQVTWICQRCEDAGLPTLRYSQLMRSGGQRPQPAPVLVIDTMGILSEVYGTAQAAFVGGALHHQVHNVLEPASHGLALAFGPFYKNSQEAIHLVDSGLAAVVQDPAQMAAWWRQVDRDAAALTQRMVTAVAELTGASNRILAVWRPLLES